MNCKLCEKPIKKYNPTFHSLNITSSHKADICPECIDKFFKWQGGIYASLFPTKTMKKKYGMER